MNKIKPIGEGDDDDPDLDSYSEDEVEERTVTQLDSKGKEVKKVIQAKKPRKDKKDARLLGQMARESADYVDKSILIFVLILQTNILIKYFNFCVDTSCS